MPVTTTDDPAERGAELHERAIVLREAGSFAEAESLCREAVTLFETAEGPQSPNVANALVEHGRLLDLVDRFVEAGPALDRALEILRPLIEIDVSRDDSDRPDDQEATDPGVDSTVLEEFVRLTVHAEAARASVFRSQGRLSEAEAGCRRALALAEARLPPGDLLVAATLNSLGVVHKFQARYAEAEPLYQRALVIAKAAGSSGDEATLLHNLGGLAHSRGDFATGEPLARRSVELREELLGPDHPTTAADRAAWGALLEGLGRLEDAERAYAEALAVFEARLGPRSLEAASALTALGGVHHARGALDDAERSYRRALDIREQVLGPDHFDLGLTLNNLAMLLVDRARRGDAVALLCRARDIFVRALGADHPHARAVEENIDALADPGRPG